MPIFGALVPSWSPSRKRSRALSRWVPLEKASAAARQRWRDGGRGGRAAQV